MESTINDKVLSISSPLIFGGPEEMMDFLHHKGNPKFRMLQDYYIGPLETSLRGLISVSGSLFIDESESSDFSSLELVTGDLILRKTALSEKYTKEEIKSMIDIKGEIHIMDGR
jgi:hypothetical protein